MGQRFRRSKKTVGLTEEDIVYLKHNTRYDEKEIREWYRYTLDQVDKAASSMKDCLGLL